MYSLKITLRDCPHPCYRELIVDDSITLRELSWTINLAFGWNSSHLYDFKVDNKKMYGIDPEGEDYANLPYKLVDEVRVHEAFDGAKKVVYTYDYGDDWIHDIKIKHVRKLGPKVELISGEGCCPPDDCGGMGGYMHMLEILKKPKSKAAKDMLEWLDERSVYPTPWPEWISIEFILKLNYFLSAGIAMNDHTTPIFVAWLEFPIEDFLDPALFDE